MMDKIKSILASAAGKKPGPPVPPRPSPAAVKKALEKTRFQSPVVQNAPQITSPIVYGRTVVYTSTPNPNNAQNVGHQPQPSSTVSCETKCFDTQSDESSTGRFKDFARNGNSARFDLNKAKNIESHKVSEVINEDPPRVILHHKSPVPRPRSKTPTMFTQELNSNLNQTRANPKVSTVLLNSPSDQPNSYANLLLRNQNLALSKINQSLKNRDDELKEKLLNEMLERSNLVEASNRHVKQFSSNLKRASSFDVLNESLGDKSSDKKVIFHEILISELSEMRRDSNPRLSSAKSSPDISQSGNFNIFEIDKKFNTFVSFEDSGVEDEGKMDDCSSSGVGDSWDSCKEMENR